MSKFYPDATQMHALALAAGAVMREHFDLERNWTTKTDTTPLTIADIKINDMVLDLFKKKFPHIHVVAEEGNRDVAGAEYSVLCDPIDGTIPFSLGIPLSAYCLTVLKDEHPIAGIIHDPFQNRTWYAEKGQGAFLNGKRVRVSTHAELKGSNVVAVWWKGCSHNMHEVVGALMEVGGAKVQNPCSLVYLGGMIASGTMEGSVFPGPGAWETAAMQIVVEEAGGRASDLYGNPILYKSNGFKIPQGSIVSNGLVHDQLIKLVRHAQDHASLVHGLLLQHANEFPPNFGKG